MNRLNNFVKKYILFIVLILIILLGVFFRVYEFGNIPNGLNQDEVSTAYEAISLSSTGLDRWGNNLPAYFLSWGSGQNALLSYLDIPVFLIAGISNITIRFWPLLFGILTIPLVCWIGLRTFGKKAGIFASLIVAVSPLFIMASRWGLESNLMPFLQASGIALLIKYREKFKARYFYLSIISLALAGYAYIISIPLSIILIVLLLLLSKKHLKGKAKHIIISLIILFVTWLPLILLIVKNYIVKDNLPFENILPFSIPLFIEHRVIQTQASSFMSALIYNIKFVYNGFNDFSLHNAIPGFAPIINRYLLFILMAFGLGRLLSLLSKFKIKFLKLEIPQILIWGWIVFGIIYYGFLSFFISPNITRTNGLYIPIVILLSIGLLSLFEFSLYLIKRLKRLPSWLIKNLWKIILVPFLIIVLYSTYSFTKYYFNSYPKQTEKTFFSGFSEVINDVSKRADGDLIYISDNITFNYLQTAFYLNIPSQDLRNYSIFDGDVDISQFNNYVFDSSVLKSSQKIYFIEFDKEPLICINEATIIKQVNRLVEGSCIVK